LLNANNFKAVVTDRIIDTAIGSAIAFVANIFLLPVWEKEQVTDNMIKMLEHNLQYFLDVASALCGKKIAINEYKLSRKNAFVSLANLSDAFNRMLSEPKTKQKKIREVHQFVVANHMLTSGIATLSLFRQQTQPNADLFSPVVNIIFKRLNGAKKKLQHQIQEKNTDHKTALRALNDKLNDLLQQRKYELDNSILESETKKNLAAFKPIADQLNFIDKAASDIEKLSNDLAIEYPK
ncbi:MAG TPA: hypothetical protein VKR53_10285, partial [Puia sp.]|nr:hypothetical protein [Puia sp.]